MSEKLYFGAMSDVDGFQYKPVMGGQYIKSLERRIIELATEIYNTKYYIRVCGNSLYLSITVDTLHNKIFKINKFDFSVESVSPLLLTYNATSILKIAADGTYIYVLSQTGNSEFKVSKLNQSDMSIVAEVNVARASDLIISNSGDFIFVFGTTSYAIQKISAIDLTIVGTYPNITNATGIYATCDDDNIYIVHALSSSSTYLKKISISTLSLISSAGPYYVAGTSQFSCQGGIQLLGSRLYVLTFYTTPGPLLIIDKNTLVLEKSGGTAGSQPRNMEIFGDLVITDTGYYLDTQSDELRNIEGFTRILDNDSLSCYDYEATTSRLTKYDVGYVIKGYRRI